MHKSRKSEDPSYPTAWILIATAHAGSIDAHLIEIYDITQQIVSNWMRVCRVTAN